MTHPNEGVLRAGLAAFARADVEAIRHLLAPEAAWHVPGRSPLAGTFVGPAAILGHFARVYELTGGTLHQECHDVLAGDDHAVALIREQAERAGVSLVMNEVILVHMDGGRVTQAWVIPEDLYAFDEFFS